jgi:signal transduction histidine kinase
MIKEKFIELYEYLFIDKKNTSLENRLFISSIIFGICMCVIGALVIYLIEKSFTLVIIIALSLATVLSVMYYFVRFRRIIKPFLLPFVILIDAGFAASWILVGGINGSNIILGMVVLILGLIISQVKMRKYVLILFMLIIVAIYLIQLYHPEKIHNFSDQTSRWIDSISTAIYASFFIYLIIRFLLNQYNIERSKAELNRNKLIQINADKDRFISILSHDLKSPFNTLLGFSGVLVEDLHKLSMAQIEDIAIDINKSAKTTYNLLEEILVWARAQQNKIPFSPQNLNLLNVCKDSIEVLEQNAVSKNIKINCTVDSQIKVFADSDMIKVVLRNLLSNAIKFTNKSGSIFIEANSNHEDIIISVSENGIGITPENLSMLFSISQVLTTTGTANEQGTGLGLLLCKDFVEKHGGRIWAESEPGKGSKFSFTMPVGIIEGAK